MRGGGWQPGWCWRLAWWSLLLFCEAADPRFEQRFANEPSPQTAVIGSTVVLPCRIINKVGVLQWTRDDFGLGNERELYAFKRYRMIGSDEEGDYSLRISPVTLEDDSYFQCQVTGWKDVPGVRSQTAKLTVYVPPERPEITQGSVVTTTAGAAVQLECVSRGGKPAAEIQWLDGSGRVVTEGIQYETEMMKDGHRMNAKSTLSFLASREHHNTVFTCTASNPALHQAFRTQVRLEVSYPPEVTITHDQDGYREGETATLTCAASGNPPALSYRWYRSGKLVQGNNSTQLVVPEVTRDSNLEDITCEVSNEVGSSRKITRLSIHYGPSFRLPPSDQYAEPGENVTLRCDVDSMPEPTIVWINQQTQTVVGKGAELSLRVNKDNIGTYLCIAKVEGFPEISGTVGVFLKGPPQVRSEKVQWGKAGDTVLVECLITGASTRSVTVTWTHRGQEVDLEEGRYEVVEDMTPTGLRHTLVIRSAKLSDFGAYNCSVQNAFGSDVYEIILNKKKTLPLLLILCGVTGGIVFVLVVALAVIMCAKRTAARQKDAKSGGLPEKTVTLQMTDQNSTANESDLKVELDQRTGSSLSNKDGELEGWDKEAENPSTPTYLASTNSYLYPETFTGIPLKINGHLTSNGGGLSYGNYADHSTVAGGSPGQQPDQTSSPAGGYVMGGNSMGGVSGFTHTSPGIVTSSQHSLYPTYTDYDAGHEAAEGVHGFTPSYNNGFNNHNFKTSSGSLPLSLHVASRGNGSTSNTSTIPRLGIPVDPSQYIVPPRTQVMQGALATHV